MRLRTLFFLVVFIFFIGFCKVILAYETEDFRANFPSEPNVYKVDMQIENHSMHITNYQATDGNGLYIISLGDIDGKGINIKHQKFFISNMFQSLISTAKKVKIHSKDQSEEKHRFLLSYIYESEIGGILWLHIGMLFMRDENQYIKITVIYPKELSDTMENKFEEFRDSIEFKN